MVAVLGDRRKEGRKVRELGGGGGGVLTLQFEDWFRLAGGPSAHSAVSVLLDCLLSSYSFSYVEKKSLERQRNRTGGATHSHRGRHHCCDATAVHENRQRDQRCSGEEVSQ